MQNTHGVSEAQIDRCIAAKAELDAAEKDVSKTFLAGYGLQNGDLVEETSSGLQYRIDFCSVYLSGRTPRVAVVGRRVWRSGRRAGREARAQTSLNGSQLKKLEVQS